MSFLLIGARLCMGAGIHRKVALPVSGSLPEFRRCFLFGLLARSGRVLPSHAFVRGWRMVIMSARPKVESPTLKLF